MTGKIRRMDHTGDTIVAEFDTENQQSVDIAQAEMTRFLEECCEQYGSTPPVFAKRIGQSDYDMLERGKESEVNIAEMEDVVMQYPLVGG